MSCSLRWFTDGILDVHLCHPFLSLLDDATVRDGGAVNLQDTLCQFGFHAICHVTFSVESVDGGNDDPMTQQVLFMAFDTAVAISFRCALTPATFVRWLTKLLDVSKSRRFQEAVHVIDAYAMSVIESKAVACHRNDIDDGSADLLSWFMAAMDDGGGGGGSELDAMFPTPAAKLRFLRDMVVTFVLAEKDRTLTALTWFFWLLAANRRCERHAHKEAVSLSCDDDGEVKGMHYLHAAITEAMRLCTPVLFNGRVMVHDDVLPSSAALRAGWYTNYSAYAMGQMEKLWGEDCLEFVPERWLGERNEFVPVDAARYPIFHAGPRLCLGKEMVYVQMKTVTAVVLWSLGSTWWHRWLAWRRRWRTR